jgi:hypothetical protein
MSVLIEVAICHPDERSSENLVVSRIPLLPSVLALGKGSGLLKHDTIVQRIVFKKG